MKLSAHNKFLNFSGNPAGGIQQIEILVFEDGVKEHSNYIVLKFGQPPPN